MVPVYAREVEKSKLMCKASLWPIETATRKLPNEEIFALLNYQVAKNIAKIKIVTNFLLFK